MKRIAFLLCCVIISQTACAQASGGQIVRKNKPKTAQCIHKLKTQSNFAGTAKEENWIPQFDEAGSFHEGLACVERNGKWGYIDTKGHVIIPLNYENARSFGEGLAPVKQNGKWGYVDKSGHVVISGYFEYACSFGSSIKNLAEVKLNEKWGYIDRTGKIIVQCIYDDTKELTDGMAAVKRDGKWGYIDEYGREMISCKYYDAHYFQNGRFFCNLVEKDMF